MSYTCSHPNLGPSSKKSKSKERNHSYTPSFSEATRNESQKGREVMRRG